MARAMTPEQVEHELQAVREQQMQEIQDCIGEVPDEDVASLVDMLAGEAREIVDALVEEGSSLTDLDRFDLVEEITDLSAELTALMERVEVWKRRAGAPVATTASAPPGGRPAPAAAPVAAAATLPPAFAPPPPRQAQPPPPANTRGVAPAPAPARQMQASQPPPQRSSPPPAWPAQSSSMVPQQSRAEQEALQELKAASAGNINSRRLKVAVDNCHRLGMYSGEVSAAEDKLREELRKEKEEAAFDELLEAQEECETPRLRKAMQAAKQAGVAPSAIEDADNRLKQLHTAKKLGKNIVGANQATCFRAWSRSIATGKAAEARALEVNQRIQDGSMAEDVIAAALAARDAGAEDSVWERGFEIAELRQAAHDQAVCAFVSEELHDLEAASAANQAAGGPRNDVGRIQAALTQAAKETWRVFSNKELPVGTKVIDLPSNEGFEIGDMIMVGGKEERTIVGFGSLVLDLPLERTHPRGAEIRKLKKKARVPGAPQVPATGSASLASLSGSNPGGDASIRSLRPQKKVLLNSSASAADHHDDSPVVRVPQRGGPSVRAGTFGSAPPGSQNSATGAPGQQPGYQGSPPGSWQQQGYPGQPGAPPPRPGYPPYGQPNPWQRPPEESESEESDDEDEGFFGNLFGGWGGHSRGHPPHGWPHHHPPPPHAFPQQGPPPPHPHGRWGGPWGQHHQAPWHHDRGYIC